MVAAQDPWPQEYLQALPQQPALPVLWPASEAWVLVADPAAYPHIFWVFDLSLPISQLYLIDSYCNIVSSLH